MLCLSVCLLIIFLVTSVSTTTVLMSQATLKVLVCSEIGPTPRLRLRRPLCLPPSPSSRLPLPLPLALPVSTRSVPFPSPLARPRSRPRLLPLPLPSLLVLLASPRSSRRPCLPVPAVVGAPSRCSLLPRLLCRSLPPLAVGSYLLSLPPPLLAPPLSPCLVSRLFLLTPGLPGLLLSLLLSLPSSFPLFARVSELWVNFPE